MSKKKKKSGKGKYYESIYSKRKKKDNKKKKNSYYGKPAFKTVKPSLSKKEAKESKKILLAPVDIPKDFMKNRAKCNHAGDLISVADFKAMTPNYGAFTPMLDQMIKTFGEENLAICKGCYDVVVKASLMSTEKMEDAIATLYAAANTILSRKRMKNSKNIEKISKIKNDHFVNTLLQNQIQKLIPFFFCHFSEILFCPDRCDIIHPIHMADQSTDLPYRIDTFLLHVIQQISKIHSGFFRQVII